MPVPFKKSVTQYYPHMKPNDVEIWERFIDKAPDYFESVEYDVPVGSAPDFISEATPEAVAGAQKLYRRKIDVVGRKDGGIYIVEIKPDAGTSSLGQVSGYALLYKRDYSPADTVHSIVLTNHLFTDVLHVADQMGVQMIEA